MLQQNQAVTPDIYPTSATIQVFSHLEGLQKDLIHGQTAILCEQL